ncbi:MAG: hypothetical protein WBO29_16130 [Albidovulum sp.]
MKLLSYDMSRLTAIFHITRLEGQAYLPSLAALLTEKYAFVGAPKSLAEMKADRIEFSHGYFEGSAIDRLEIYDDGIVISSRSSTDFIDRFLDDMLRWAVSELGISVVNNRTVNRVYESSLIIEADEKILTPLKALEETATLIQSHLLEASGMNVPYYPSGYIIAADHSKNPQLKPALFRLERRFASEFELNQFYSIAPLRTPQHIGVLEKIEATFLTSTS